MNGYVIGLLVLGALGIVAGICAPKIKGWLGEAAVAGVLSALPAHEYRVLHNVMLRTKRGTSQIDHIVVSVYGIFVIETKNYKGWITGSEYGDQWTENIYGKKYRFYNPLKQNYGHVKVLQQLLELPETSFIPIVVFSRRAELKVKTSKPVVYTSGLKKEIESHHEKKLTPAMLSALASKIESGNVDSKENRKSHVAGVRSQIKAEKADVARGVCPRCGGPLTERKGKYGLFLGCGNYPKCRYTAK